MARKTRIPHQEAKMAPVFSFKAKAFALTLIFAVFSTVTYAFASSSTGNSKPAGQGAEAISGYAVSNISYKQGDDLSKIASVSLSLDAPASKVQIKLTRDQANWYDCVNVSGNNWSCNTDNSSILSANELQVVALGN
jgi:hypothetical protein